ncbi:MAG: hydroxyacid dehydrogenase [Chloroflexi bacterium]|nr:hydroxyacid dehydrogenase [Chloroflexota bacterium]
MSPVTIVVPDDFPISYGSVTHPDLARLLLYGTVVTHTTRFADRDEFFSRIAEADVVINVRAYSRFDEEALSHAPKLKMISVQGVGTDNIDLAAAKARGITVTNTPGVNSVSVAELAIGLIFAVVRAIPLSDTRMRAGTWQHPPAFELQGKTIGLLGLGAIGAHTAKLAAGLGMKPIAWSWNLDQARAERLGVELVDRDELFRRSDIVSVHLKNTPEARGSVGARELSLMKPTAILINTARAAILDQDAVVEALKAGQIAGAGLDVYLTEPLPLAENPFAVMENVVLMPHAGGVTAESSVRSNKAPVDNAIAYLEGRPANVVNP